MKEYSENELKNKAEAYCSSAEHCSWEVENKLKQWGASDEVAQNIIAHLQKERYVNNSRFCQAFVHDKYLFNRWGRQRIRQELRMRQLDDKDIACGMEEIDDKEYMESTWWRSPGYLMWMSCCSLTSIMLPLQRTRDRGHL